MCGQGHQALILGASSSIGVDLCHLYLQAGYQVIAQFHRHSDALQAIASNQAALKLIQLDLRDLESSQSFLAEGILEKCDVFVGLASMSVPSRFSDCDVATIMDSLRVGALSNYVFINALAPGMLEKGWGRIVIGSSIGVKYGGSYDSFAYALAHHTSEFIPKCLREWSQHNILTNVVRIGVTDTPLHRRFPGKDLSERAALIPIKRPATPREIADYLFWLGSHQNSFVTGQTLAVSGGE